MTEKEYLELTGIFQDERTKEQIEQIKNYNKELINNYPFLKPYNVMSDKDIEDYDYEYTWLDDMPDGWRVSFGIQMCEEIKQELLKFLYIEDPWTNEKMPVGTTWLDAYRVVQIKEKYGELRWYDAGIPKGSKVWDIINKYSILSQSTCIVCGQTAKWESQGWINPYCDSCAQQVVDRENETTKMNRAIEDLFIQIKL